MDGALQPYPQYRDSGLPWIGRIPAHWEVRRNGRLFAQRNETGYPHLPVLEVSLKTGITIRDLDNSTRKQMMSEREKYKRAAKGDIVYNMMRMWQGAVGVAPEDGLISPAYVVARPLPGTESRYFAYLFRTADYMNEVNKYSHGIVTDRNRLYWDEFKQIPSLFPPPDEQRAIADYLDRKNQEIQLYIQNKQRLIALLNEHKLAIINQAVTRGMGNSASFGPSDVGFLGEIPEYWKAKRLKFLVNNITEQTSEKLPEDLYIALEHIESWTGRVILPEEEIPFESQVKRFQPGDVLFGKLRPYLAKVILAQHKGVCVGELLVLRRRSLDVMPEYLEQKLRSPLIIDVINSSTVGAKMPRAAWTFIGNLRIPYPPSHDEQTAIVKHILGQSERIDAAINLAQRQIALMQEYRTALISEAVTGRVDVRGVRQTGKVLPLRKRNVHFCRSVLAAEIVDRHQDTPRFGWIKLQKAMILVERHLQLDDIESRPLRAVAGPFDNPMMRSIHAQFEHQKWFKPVKTEMGLAYRPLEKRGEHRKYFDRYWGDKRGQFDRLMALVKPMTTEQAEIVATLYMAWNDFLIRGEPFDDDRLVDEVLHHWDESKRRISEERWRRAISWMREKDLTPEGFGAATVGGSGTVEDGDDRYE